nr:CFI-box-CTERM domain-containing protein [Candidatus Nitrosopumilus salaria]
MRLMGFLAFVLLSISILSYGISGVVFATSDPNPALSVSSDTEIYSNGATVKITGSIKDYDAAMNSGKAITFILKSPENNLVTIGQFTPKSDGTFEHTFVAGGPLWKLNGDYTLELHHGADKSQITINYVGGEQVITKPKPPVVTEPEPPVVTEPEPPVVTEPEPEPEPEPQPTCGAGTELVNGICQVIKTEKPDSKGGGCLIATAAYGTELAPQVQFLREIRDNTVMSTTTGTAFMSGFNQLYYSFSPTIADMERENPIFQEVVRAFITPMISTLSIMTLADDGSEVEVLGLGISVIALNLGMYIAAPALIGFKVHNHIKSRK